MSLQVSAPLGQYDDNKLLNLGNNRWSFRPELGISKAWDPWTFEVAPSVTFFSDNTDFFGGNTFCAGADLCRAGTRHLHVPVRHMDGAGRELFCGWPYRAERRKER